MAQNKNRKQTANEPLKEINRYYFPLVVNAQYIKDFSLENPNPLKNLTEDTGRPDISIHVEANAHHLSDYRFEVSLKTKVLAKHQEETVFIIELDYAGIFSVDKNIPESELKPLLLIKCPEMLFPFSRSIIAQMTQEAGYPSLLLTPIDFSELYQQQLSADNQSSDSKKTRH